MPRKDAAKETCLPQHATEAPPSVSDHSQQQAKAPARGSRAARSPSTEPDFADKLLALEDLVAKRDANDRTNVLVHEIGHMTVAMALGFPAGMDLYRTGTDDPVHEKLWDGQCHFVNRRPMTNREKTMIGLAGWIAVLLHEDPDADLYAQLCAFDASDVSDSDWQMITLNNRWIIHWGTRVAEILNEHADFRAWAMDEGNRTEVIRFDVAWAEFRARRKPRKRR